MAINCDFSTVDNNLQILQDKLQDNLQNMIQSENLQKEYPEQQFAKKTRNAYLHFWRKKWTLASIFKFCKKWSGRTFCIKKVSRKFVVNFAKTLSTITICKEDDLVWQFASFAKRYPGRQVAKFVKKNYHRQKYANCKYLITSALSTRQ